MSKSKYLPSPYLPHSCGLLHLPRMIEKIRRHASGTLSDEYTATLGKGFDALLCEHLDLSFGDVLAAVEGAAGDMEEVDRRLSLLFPAELRVAQWNRKLVQRGLQGVSLERLQQRKRELNLSHRDDIVTMCDLLEVVEGRL